MLVGKQMQFFGTRANLAKCLLYAINGGRDEMTGQQIGPEMPPLLPLPGFHAAVPFLTPWIIRRSIRILLMFRKPWNPLPLKRLIGYVPFSGRKGLRHIK